MSKTLIVTACVLIVLFACLPNSDARYHKKHAKGHSISQGKHSFLDALLFHKEVKIGGSWFPWPRVQAEDVCFPDGKKKHHPKFTITSFKVTDLEKNGQGGFAFIKKGGVGSHKLCLHLKTQRGKGLHFRINVWGHTTKPIYIFG